MSGAAALPQQGPTWLVGRAPRTLVNRGGAGSVLSPAGGGSPLEPAEGSRAMGKRVFSRRRFQALQLVSLAPWGRVWLTSQRLSQSLSLVTAWQGKRACQGAQWGEGPPTARARDVGLRQTRSSRPQCLTLGSPTALPESRSRHCPAPRPTCAPRGPPCPPAGGPGTPSQVGLRHQG